MGFLSDAANIGSAVAGIVKSFSDDDGGAGKVNKQAQQNLALSSSIANALANPNSKLFKDLTAQERDAARTSFAEGIDRLLIEHARAKAKGAPGYLTSDRRDEALASAIGRQREVGAAEARQAARNTLAQAAGAAGVGLSAAPQVAQTALTVDLNDRNRFAGGLDLVTEGLGALEDSTLGKTVARFFDRSSTPTGSEVRIG